MGFNEMAPSRRLILQRVSRSWEPLEIYDPWTEDVSEKSFYPEPLLSKPEVFIPKKGGEGRRYIEYTL